MNFKALKILLSTILVVSITQIQAFAIDDVWGGMGLTKDAIQLNSRPGTVFDTPLDPEIEPTKVDLQTQSSPYNSSINDLSRNNYRLFVC